MGSKEDYKPSKREHLLALELHETKKKLEEIETKLKQYDATRVAETYARSKLKRTQMYQRAFIKPLIDIPYLKPKWSRCMHHLGNDVYLYDGMSDGKTFMHIRKREDYFLPINDGICLTVSKCKALLDQLPHLDNAIKRIRRGEDVFYRAHLGGYWYVAVYKDYVDIRKFYANTSGTWAMQTGVSLNFEQYDELKTGLEELPSCIPDFCPL